MANESRAAGIITIFAETEENIQQVVDIFNQNLRKKRFCTVIENKPKSMKQDKDGFVAVYGFYGNGCGSYCDNLGKIFEGKEIKKKKEELDSIFCMIQFDFTDYEKGEQFIYDMEAVYSHNPHTAWECIKEVKTEYDYNPYSFDHSYGSAVLGLFDFMPDGYDFDLGEDSAELYDNVEEYEKHRQEILESTLWSYMKDHKDATKEEAEKLMIEKYEFLAKIDE